MERSPGRRAGDKAASELPLDPATATTVEAPAIVVAPDEPKTAEDRAHEQAEASKLSDEDALDRAGRREAAVRITEGVRRINYVWEFTQSYVAVVVVSATALAVLYGRVILGTQVSLPAEWWTIVGLVVGFYFGRSNHTRSAGNDPSVTR